MYLTKPISPIQLVTFAKPLLQGASESDSRYKI